MKIGFLILVHKEPNQIISLINRLSNGEKSHCFVHIDSNSSTCKKILGARIDNASFYSGFKTPWGSFNTVRAELLLLERAMDWGADRVVMLSGQDIPIKSNNYIENFFLKNKEVGFIEGGKMPIANWTEHQGGLYRVNRVHYNWRGKIWVFPLHTKKKPFNSVFNGMANVFHKFFLKSNLIADYYNGSHWWSITREQTKYVLKFSKEGSILKAFRYSRNSDEIFVTTILHNSPNKKFTLKNTSLHFVKGLQNSAHADILDEKDYEKIIKSPFLFARKIDLNKSSKLLDLLA